MLVMKLTMIFLLVLALQVTAESTVQPTKYTYKPVALQVIFSVTKQQIKYVINNKKIGLAKMKNRE